MMTGHSDPDTSRDALQVYLRTPRPPLWPRLVAALLVTLFGLLVGGLALAAWILDELSWIAVVPPLLIGAGSIGLGILIALWAVSPRRNDPL